jgi:hypothetical protein
MSDDVVVALREIAQLLRVRVDQTAEMSKRADERLAKLPDPRANIPDFEAMTAKHDAEEAEHREEAAHRRAEDVEFRERLLGAIERQNELLGRLIERSTP